MTTQPRMSAPIGRLRIRSSEGRKGRVAGAVRWKPAEAPVEAEVAEADEARAEGECPRFYPFPLRVTGESND